MHKVIKNYYFSYLIALSQHAEMHSLVNELGNLMMQDMKKIDTLNDSSALVFTSKTRF